MTLHEISTTALNSPRASSDLTQIDSRTLQIAEPFFPMIESGLSVTLLVVADPIQDLFDSSIPFTPRERQVELAFDRRLDLAEGPTGVFFPATISFDPPRNRN